MRRLHVESVSVGRVTLDASNARHARDVLRLGVDAKVELFDTAGNVAAATLIRVDTFAVEAEIDALSAKRSAATLVVASAVPKGERADWLVEKLSELGVTKWLPLVTERSVVHPTGEGKTSRWQRLAIESAKQCRRAGVMEIAPLTRLSEAMAATSGGVFLSTRPGAASLLDAREVTTCFIGPEGGWTEAEEAAMLAAGLTAARLTETVLRTETAAITAAAVLRVRANQESYS